MATAERSISLTFSALSELDIKQNTTYFVWLNIDLFSRKSITNAFGAQTFHGGISKLWATKLKQSRAIKTTKSCATTSKHIMLTAM